MSVTTSPVTSSIEQLLSELSTYLSMTTAGVWAAIVNYDDVVEGLHQRKRRKGRLRISISTAYTRWSLEGLE